MTERAFVAGTGERVTTTPHHTDDAPDASQLVGRGRDLAALLVRLATARLVCLTGLPGVGRTRLAREAAGQVRREVVWESAACYEPEMLPGVGARLRHRFAGARRPLLVLDDIDHLGGAATALVASLLLDLPELTVLVVAERPCHLRGESVMVLRPLAVRAAPGDGRPSEALQLLRAVLGDAAVDRDPGGAARLCRRFGGVPGPLLEAARAGTAACADEVGPEQRAAAAR
ncbi:non-specific serine/threonine protein kinase [Streptomyces sp. PsTaAH-137]|nr:non-specific serine/threonine protein kinase [Streptomyces sp. PsTaAH-137]